MRVLRRPPLHRVCCRVGELSEFDNQFYLQLIGVGMGRHFAPSAAIIYLRKFDEMAMPGFHIKPQLFSRFLDDIFGIWPGSRDSPTDSD